MNSPLSSLRGFFETAAHQYPNLGLILYHGRTDCWTADKERFGDHFCWDFDRAFTICYSSEYMPGEAFEDNTIVWGPQHKHDLYAVSLSGDRTGATVFFQHATTAGRTWANDCGARKYGALYWSQAMFLKLQDITTWESAERPVGGWASALKSVSPNIASVLLIDMLLNEETEWSTIGGSIDLEPLNQKMRSLVDSLGVREPLMSSRQNIPPTERESNILEALGDGEMIGAELAEKAGYPFNSAFRTTVSNMKKRGILAAGPSGRGYRRGHCQ